MIDQERFIREFGPHILHVQAKDVEIDRDGLYERGTLSSAASAGRSRGSRAWARRTGAASSPPCGVPGYDGDVIIEHEDRDFEGDDELVKRGFLLARDILRPYIK